MEPIHLFLRKLFLILRRVHTRLRFTATTSSGFSIVELVVVVGIMTLILGVTITGQSSFNNSILLTDTTYTVAYSLKQVQNFGVFGRTTNSVSNTGYGMHLSSITPGTYDLFADTTSSSQTPSPTQCPLGISGTPEARPGNCRFDPLDPIVKTYTFSKGYTIKKFSGKTSFGSVLASDSPSPLNITSLDIVFLRPNTRAVITGLNGNGILEVFTCVEISIAPASGTKIKTIRVSDLGEISVGQTCP
jgi:hypothetical protein